MQYNRCARHTQPIDAHRPLGYNPRLVVASAATVPAGAMSNVLHRIGALPGVRELSRRLSSGGRTCVTGTAGSGPALVAAYLLDQGGGHGAIVCAGGEEAEELAEDVNLLRPGLACCFPALEVLPGDIEEPSESILMARLAVLRHLALGGTDEGPADAPTAGYLAPGPDTRVVVASIRALLQPTCTADELRRGSLSVAVGDTAEPKSLVEWLADNGYWPAPQVRQPGQYCLRGGILDVYSHGAPQPVRVEFFDDKVDSIRTFDAGDQLSTGRTGQCRFTMAEHTAGDEGRARGSLLSFLGPDTPLFMVDAPALAERARTIYERTEKRHLLTPPADVLGRLDAMPGISFRPEDEEDGGDVHVECRCCDTFGPDLDSTLVELGRICDDCDETVVYCISPAEADRLRALLADREFAAPARMRFDIGRLNHGAIFPDAGLALIPHHRLFGRYRQRRLIPQPQAGRPLESVAELQPGDLVVHVRHGIGRFRSISAIAKEGGRREHLEIEFADEVRVHVPCERIELIHRYIGVGGREPALSKVRGLRWSKTTKNAQKAIEDLAAELLELQAMRETQPGIAFPADTEWQRQFESEFPYEETDDQVRAIEDVQRDMKTPRPMDRLLCGDVGYGKTEVAMRAAFAAAVGERQVAVLVPTTILAQQHYRTFRERMADYPIRIEMLSRFLTDGEADRVLEAMARGAADIVIGTHRLLGNRVRFKDLGLVIIDEEQRFGVQHKEKLKKLRATVDVLTMTATPIPRTLHMALMGLREISSLQTPPRDRQAIRTKVGKFRADLLRQAVLRELNREGQVFIIHNRVRTIDAFAGQVRQAVPEARVAVAHGQMRERELAATMNRFLDGDVDVLVSTTIVESGLDIPNANTLIVDRADMLGLAEMHQLRGRVGRYIHKAYAYFFFPVSRPITPEAQDRLDAIRRFSQLGAGFDIALRDLEIRGAGNILGPRQSGHIAAIGYHLYCRLLTHTVRGLRQEPDVQWPDVTIDIGLAAHLPDDYVPTPGLKMQIYRQISRATSVEDVDEAARSLRDRFGPVPEPATNLLCEARLRVLAGEAGVGAIRLLDGRVHLEACDPDRMRARVDAGRALRMAGERMAVLDGGFPKDDPPALADLLCDLLAPRPGRMTDAGGQTPGQ